MTEQNIKQEVMAFTEGYDMIPVTTEAEYQAALKLVDAAHARKKHIEEWFAPKVEAAHRSHKLLTTERAELLKPLEAFIRHLNGQTGHYIAAKTQKIAEITRQAQEQAKAAGVDTSLMPAPVAKVEAGEGRMVVEVWSFEVADEAAVPAEFKALDLAKIRKQVQLTKDKTNIPGIRPIKSTEVRRSGGRHGG